METLWFFASIVCKYYIFNLLWLPQQKRCVYEQLAIAATRTRKNPVYLTVTLCALIIDRKNMVAVIKEVKCKASFTHTVNVTGFVSGILTTVTLRVNRP